MLSVKKDVWDEMEAAQALGISLPRLHSLLDEHVFTIAHPRPEGCTFRSSDLVLLEFWLRSDPNPQVVSMPRRCSKNFPLSPVLPIFSAFKYLVFRLIEPSENGSLLA